MDQTQMMEILVKMNTQLEAMIQQLLATLEKLMAAPMPTPVAPTPPVVATPARDPRFPNWDGVPGHANDPWISAPAVPVAPPVAPSQPAVQPPRVVPAETVVPPVKTQTLADMIGTPAFDANDSAKVIATNGAVRVWPAPHMELGENAWGYATRCSRIINPVTGKPFFDGNVLGIYLLGTPGGADGQAEVLHGQYHYTADRFTYPMDWQSAEDKARNEAAAKRDREANNGHGASWVSGYYGDGTKMPDAPVAAPVAPKPQPLLDRQGDPVPVNDVDIPIEGA